jgi:hypothetical protein
MSWNSGPNLSSAIFSTGALESPLGSAMVQIGIGRMNLAAYYATNISCSRHAASLLVAPFIVWTLSCCSKAVHVCRVPDRVNTSFLVRPSPINYLVPKCPHSPVEPIEGNCVSRDQVRISTCSSTLWITLNEVAAHEKPPRCAIIRLSSNLFVCTRV